MLPSPDVDPPKVSQSMFQMLLTKPRILPQQEENLMYQKEVYAKYCLSRGWQTSSGHKR